MNEQEKLNAVFTQMEFAANEATAVSINYLVDRLHKAELDAGWYKNPYFETQIHAFKTLGLTDDQIKGVCEIAGVSTDKIVNVAEKLMLIVSEVSEAMEGDRKNLMDDKLPHRKMLEVELADAFIRICGLAGWLKMDLGGAIMEKFLYNQLREDHKFDNRMKDGGKKY